MVSVSAQVLMRESLKWKKKTRKVSWRMTRETPFEYWSGQKCVGHVVERGKGGFEGLMGCFPTPETVFYRLILSSKSANQAVRHPTEVWLLAEIYPCRYDAQLNRRWGSLPFYRTQNDDPEFSRAGNRKVEGRIPLERIGNEGTFLLGIGNIQTKNREPSRNKTQV